MKRLFTLILIFLSLAASAQQLHLYYQGEAVGNGDTIRYAYTSDDFGRDILRPVIAYANESSESYHGHVQAISQDIADGHSLQFCIFETCVSDLSTPIAISLAANESVDVSDARVLHFTFTPNASGVTTAGFAFTNDSVPSDQMVFYVQYYSPTGIDVVSSLESIRAYPNPATSGVNVEFDASLAGDNNLVIKNLTGATIYSQPLSENGKMYVDLTSFRNGVYFYGVEDKSGKMLLTKKLVVK